MKKIFVLLATLFLLSACTKNENSAGSSQPNKEEEAVADGSANPANAPDEMDEKKEKAGAEKDSEAKESAQKEAAQKEDTKEE